MKPRKIYSRNEIGEHKIFAHSTPKKARVKNSYSICAVWIQPYHFVRRANGRYAPEYLLEGTDDAPVSNLDRFHVKKPLIFFLTIMRNT